MTSSSRRTTPEFWLVVTMLGVLSLLVWIILSFDVGLPSNIDGQPTAGQILDYRKGILTIIITAFGAWVGAGAAYFFGRENLREAANSLLKIHYSPAERLKQMTVQNLPRTKIDWAVKTDTSVKEVLKRINEGLIGLFRHHTKDRAATAATAHFRRVFLA